MNRVRRSYAAVVAVQRRRQVVFGGVLRHVEAHVDVGEQRRVALKPRVDVGRLVSALPAVALRLHVGRVQFRLVTRKRVR